MTVKKVGACRGNRAGLSSLMAVRRAASSSVMRSFSRSSVRCAGNRWRWPDNASSGKRCDLKSYLARGALLPLLPLLVCLASRAFL
ncbi:MAG: hypothetical protein ACREFJ_14075, partial [Acetobacteraceae bacterium]